MLKTIVSLVHKLFFILAFFFVDAARSQVIDGVEIVTPRIITGEWDSVTKQFPVAIEFTIVKDWHLYWLNPGDAGSPPDVKWALPDGWTAEKLQFPVPKHVVTDDGESYAYYDKLILYTEIISPRAPQPKDVIEAAIKWVVCKDICVSGKRDVKSSYADLRVHHEWPKLPLVKTLAEAGVMVRPFRFARSTGDGEHTKFLEFFRGTDTLKITDFYPLPYSDRPMYVSAEDGMLARRSYMARTDAEELRASEDQWFDRVNGLIFIGDKAYWLKVP